MHPPFEIVYFIIQLWLLNAVVSSFPKDTIRIFYDEKAPFPIIFSIISLASVVKM